MRPPRRLSRTPARKRLQRDTTERQRARRAVEIEELGPTARFVVVDGVSMPRPRPVQTD